MDRKYRLGLLAIALTDKRLYNRLIKETGGTGSAHDIAKPILDLVSERYDQASTSVRRTLNGVHDDPKLVLQSDYTVKHGLLLLLATQVLDDVSAALGVQVANYQTPSLKVLISAVRIETRSHRPSDTKVVREWIKTHAQGAGSTAPAPVPPGGGSGSTTSPSTTGGTMPLPAGFAPDIRAMPDFNADEFWAAIEERFESWKLDPTVAGSEAEAHAVYVAGRLLRESYLDPKDPGFESAFEDAIVDGFGTTEGKNSTPKKPVRISNAKTYLDVATELKSIKGAGDPVTWQGLAYVSDYLIDLEPVDDNQATKIRAGDEEYIAKAPSYDTLDLPEIITEDTAVGELEPQNIRSVAMVYAANQLELAQLFNAVDRAAEDWMDGLVAVGEPAGRLFDTYVFEGDRRLDTSARQIQYKRVLGIGGRSQGGGDLHGLMLRAFSAVSEWNRRRDLSAYLHGGSIGTAGRLSDEYPRKALRELAASASLYGWAYTQFAAKRIGNHIRDAVEIIEHPEVQKAYGAQHAWAVVEQIGSMYFGSIPNIAKHRTMASAGHAALDLLASKAKALGASVSTDPLFPGPGSRAKSVFTADEYDRLLRHAENFLAVNGVNDAERQRASEPRDSAALPSVPSFGGAGGGFGGISPESLKQLEQMASQGQAPSFDQFRQMFPNLN